jgi:hypothetical protein
MGMGMRGLCACVCMGVLVCVGASMGVLSGYAADTSCKMYRNWKHRIGVECPSLILVCQHIRVGGISDLSSKMQNVFILLSAG